MPTEPASTSRPNKCSMVELSSGNTNSVKARSKARTPSTGSKYRKRKLSIMIFAWLAVVAGLPRDAQVNSWFSGVKTKASWRASSYTCRVWAAVRSHVKSRTRMSPL